jgi:hypothetical protein
MVCWAERCWRCGGCYAAIPWAGTGWTRCRKKLAADWVAGRHIRTQARVLAEAGRARLKIVNYSMAAAAAQIGILP